MHTKHPIYDNPRDPEALYQYLADLPAEERRQASAGFLNAATHFPDLSVRHQLVIGALSPEAEYIGTRRRWAELGAEKRNRVEPIMLLRPVFDSRREHLPPSFLEYEVFTDKQLQEPFESKLPISRYGDRADALEQLGKHFSNRKPGSDLSSQTKLLRTPPAQMSPADLARLASISDDLHAELTAGFRASGTVLLSAAMPSLSESQRARQDQLDAQTVSSALLERLGFAPSLSTQEFGAEHLSGYFSNAANISYVAETFSRELRLATSHMGIRSNHLSEDTVKALREDPDIKAAATKSRKDYQNLIPRF